jgi:hypothetical protein
MKDVSLDSLVDDPKAAMVRVRSNRESDFLRGVTYHPNVPPKQLVSRPNPRLIYRPGTFLFVAIPYLGQEALSSAQFRKKLLPPPGNNYIQDGIAGRLTAYHTVDNYATDRPSSNSSLNLLEYRFPLQGETPAFKEWQRVLEMETDGESTMAVVHQAWFMVFDNGMLSHSFL